MPSILSCVLLLLLALVAQLAASEFVCAPTSAVTLSPNLDLTSLTPDEAAQVKSCDDGFGFPEASCGASDITVSRQVACVQNNIVQADNTSCIDATVTVAPAHDRTDFACVFYCSSSTLAPGLDLSTLTKGVEYDDCTADNFFTQSSCVASAGAERTRDVLCAQNNIVDGPTCTPSNTLTPPASTAPNDTSNCVHFYFCANTHDEWVPCTTTGLVDELCTAHPFDPLTQTCTIDPDNRANGSYQLPHTTQCAVGTGCKDLEGGFDQSKCLDVYQYQTTTKPCTDAQLVAPNFTCPCVPRAEYKCASTQYTLQQLQQNPSLLSFCDADALFPESSTIKACSDTIAKYYRSIVCVDVDGVLSLVPSDAAAENTTPCAPLPPPTNVKEYPGQLECHYAVKCGAFNATLDSITMDSPDCPQYNSNLPSPCFSAPQIDIFSLMEEDEVDPPPAGNQLTSAPITSEFAQQVLILQQNAAAAAALDFCNGDNKRMTGVNGYQHRLQRCIATVEETALDGTTVTRQLDPSTTAFDQTCQKAANFATTSAPQSENCCTCKIGYSSGWTKEPKTRDVQGDIKSRPWNEYNNCRLCSAYGTFVFPQPSLVVVGLLTLNREMYNTAVQKLIDANTQNLGFGLAPTDPVLIDQRHAFLTQFFKDIEYVGGFESPRINPMFIEPRFISVVGDSSSLYNTNSHRRDDYVAQPGDLAIIATFNGLCLNGKDDSLSQTYSPWNTLREDLALPKVPYNATEDDSDSWHLPFNPLGLDVQDILTKHTQSAATRAQLASARFGAAGVHADAMNTLVFDDFDISFGGKNRSDLYNTQLFEQYRITNVTTQAMYSPTCTNYYACPRGRTPFIRSIDDVDTSSATTIAVILLSLGCLLFNIAFIVYCCLGVTSDSQAKSYQPSGKVEKQDETTPIMDKNQQSSDAHDVDTAEVAPTASPGNGNEVELQPVDSAQ